MPQITFDQCPHVISNSWHILGFPDGDDGVVLSASDYEQLDRGAFLSLAEVRVLALNAVLGWWVRRGFGMRRTRIGEWCLGREGGTVTLSVGFPLTFWLRRERWQDAVRRFIDADADCDDCLLQDLSERTWHDEADAGFAEHLRVLRDIFEIGADVEELSTLERDAHAGTSEPFAWWVSELASWRAKTADIKSGHAVSQRLIARARAKFAKGHRLWLGMDSRWLRPDDTWSTHEDFAQWSRALSDDRILYSGTLPMVWSDTARRAALVGRFLTVVSDEKTGHGCDLPFESLFVAMDDPRVAAVVMGREHYERDHASWLRAGFVDGIYIPLVQIRTLLFGLGPENLVDRLDALDTLTLAVGRDAASCWFDPSWRCRAESLCHELLDAYCSQQQVPGALDFTTNLAFTFRLKSVVARILVAPELRKEAQARLMLYQHLNPEFALMVSSLCPGPALLDLLGDLYKARAVDLDRGLEAQALALAIAWRRCEQQPSDHSSVGSL